MLNTDLGSGAELGAWGLQPLQTEGLRSDILLSRKGEGVGICPGATRAACSCLDSALVAGLLDLGKATKPPPHCKRPWDSGMRPRWQTPFLLSLEDILMCWWCSV